MDHRVPVAPEVRIVSAKLLAAVWDCDLPGEEKAVALALASLVDDDGLIVLPPDLPLERAVIAEMKRLARPTGQADTP